MMRKWLVRVDNKFSKQISRLPEEVQLLAYQAMEDLAIEGPVPFGWNAKKLKDMKYRLRLKREYRMIYYVYKQIITIEIIFVGHRKDAEKHY